MRFTLQLVMITLGFMPLATEATTAWNPASADLLFASNRDGNSEIYLLPAGQQDWVNLSRHEAADNWPVW